MLSFPPRATLDPDPRVCSDTQTIRPLCLQVQETNSGSGALAIWLLAAVLRAAQPRHAGETPTQSRRQHALL